MFGQRINITQNNGAGAGGMLALLAGGAIVAVIVGQAIAAIMTALITIVVITGCACLGLATVTGAALAVLRYRHSIAATPAAAPPIAYTAAPVLSSATGPLQLAGYHPTTGQPLYQLAPTAADVVPDVLPADLAHARITRRARPYGGAA